MGDANEFLQGLLASRKVAVAKYFRNRPVAYLRQVIIRKVNDGNAAKLSPWHSE